MRWATVLAIPFAVQLALAQPQPGFPRKAALTPEETVAQFAAAGNEGLPTFWKRMGVPEPAQTGDDDSKINWCGEGCKADLSKPYLYIRGGGFTRDRIVRLIFDDRVGSRLLYFRNDRMLGFVDVIGDYYEPPEVTLEEDHFNFVDHPRIGSGVTDTSRTWYHVSDKGLQLEVSALEKGSLYFGRSPTYLYWAKRLPTVQQDEHFAVFLYYLAVWDYDGKSDWIIFDDTRRVVFSRSSLDQPMKFDPEGSDLTEQDLIHVYSYNQPTPEHFVRFSLKHLLAIARGTDEWKKDWVRGYVKNVKNTPEKRQVLAALGGR